MSPWRVAYAIALIAMVGFLGWRVIASELDRRAPPFEGTTAERLSRNPLDGDAFADLAVAMRGSEDQAAVLEMHRIAARRDPRDLRIRAWLADYFLRAGNYPAAMEQLDVMLRLEPELRTDLTPMMAVWTDDLKFAKALAAQLSDEPVWYGTMLAALRKNITREGIGAVFQVLREAGALDDAQTGYWLDALLNAGKWDAAYKYWASGMPDVARGSLPLLYNGDFEQEPSQQGFDWRTGRRSGSFAEFEPVDRASGQAAHLVFSGRPVDLADLEHALVLPPGIHVIEMRQRAVALRSDQGLRWTVTCHDRSRPIGAGERLEGTFDWRRGSFVVTVPGSNCPGQWLRLENPAPRGSASSVSGELWVDDVTVSGEGPDSRSLGES